MVTDLKVDGPVSRTSFVAGIVDWVGAAPPNDTDIRGRRVLDQGLTRIEAITQTGAAVLGCVPLPKGFVMAPNFRDYGIGIVHRVWGWKALPRLIEERLDAGS